MSEPTEKQLREFYRIHRKDLCLTPLCPKRLEASQPAVPKVVTREQYCQWVDEIYLCTEEDAPKVLDGILADLDIVVEKEKKG